MSYWAKKQSDDEKITATMYVKCAPFIRANFIFTSQCIVLKRNFDLIGRVCFEFNHCVTLSYGLSGD